MSQTRCKMDVFPAFALPMMSTLNWIFGTRGESGGARDRAGDDAGAGDGGDGAEAGDGVDRPGAGDGGDGAEAGDGGDGAEAAAGVGAGAGDRAGDDAGAGDGGGEGSRQQVLCFTPIARKCGEKKDWAACVDRR